MMSEVSLFQLGLEFFIINPETYALVENVVCLKGGVTIMAGSRKNFSLKIFVKIRS